MKKILCLLIINFISIFTFSQSDEKFGVSSNTIPSGLHVGDNAPAFKSIDQNGEKFDLLQELKSNTVVILFYRGNWCPVCNRYLKSFIDSLQLIQDKGAQVVAVTPNAYEGVNSMSKKLNDQLTIISDTSNQLMNQYKVSFNVTDDYQKKIEKALSTNIAESNNQKRAKLPVPATYIIDKTGKIHWKQFDLNYKNRASVKSIINNLPD